GWLPATDVGLVSKCFLIALTLILVWTLVRRRVDQANPRLGVGLVICFALATDFFLPHRWGYVDVMLLLPLAVLWPALWDHSNTSRVALLFLGVGLVAGACLVPQLSLYYATLTRSWLVMASLTALALINWSHPIPSVDPHR